MEKVGRVVGGAYIGSHYDVLRHHEGLEAERWRNQPYPEWLAHVALLALETESAPDDFMWDMDDPEWQRLHALKCQPIEAMEIRFRGAVQ